MVLERMIWVKPSFFVKDKDFYKTLVRLSLPAALQSLISLLVLMADNVMVSRFHAETLAPVSQANSVSTFVTAALSGLGGGAMVLISQYWGKRDTESVKRVFAVTASVCLLFAAVIVSVIELFPHAVISVVLDRQEAALTPIAISYLRIACLAYLPLALSSALTGCLKGVEVVKMTLYAAVISLLSNVCLNAVLIFGLFGLPALGVQGAAIATVAARIIELVVIWFYCFRVQKAISIQPKELLKHESWAWRDYAKFGLPVGLTDAQWALVGLLKMAIIGYLGKTMMSAMNITDTMINLGTMFTFALAGGACVLVGKAVGAGDYARARQYSQTIQVLFACVGVVMCTIVFSLRRPFISLYGQEQDVVTLASQMIAIGAVTLLGTTYHASCFVGINRGAGDSRFVMTVDMICGWLVVLPLTYLAAFVWKLPLPLVFLCTRIDQCFKWIIAMVRLRGDRWIKNVTRP